MPVQHHLMKDKLKASISFLWTYFVQCHTARLHLPQSILSHMFKDVIIYVELWHHILFLGIVGGNVVGQMLVPTVNINKNDKGKEILTGLDKCITDTTLS